MRSAASGGKAMGRNDNDQAVAAYRKLAELRAGRPDVGRWPASLRAALSQAALAAAGRGITPFFPPIIHIEPTNACNCRCIICPRRNMTRPVGYIEPGLFEKIVSQAAGLGPSEIRLFNFGEPTLHPELPAMIKLCRSLGLAARFQTNGLLFDEKLSRALLESGLDYVGISVNGLTDAEYSIIRPGFKLRDLLEKTRVLRAAASETGQRLHIHINAQVLKQDVQDRGAEIEEFKRTWAGLADSISVSGLSRYDRILILEKGVAVEQALQRLERKPDEKVACHEPFDRIVIKWDGRATACCADFDAQAVVGDLNTRDLEQVWNGAPFRALREKVAARRYSELPVCRGCPKFYSDEFHVVFRRTG